MKGRGFPMVSDENDEDVSRLAGQWLPVDRRIDAYDA
jgi:hypothetical protein